MEILQTIWTALSSENEVLATILVFPLTFLEAYVTMLLFTSILKIQTTKHSSLLYVTMFSIIGYIARFFIPNPYGTIVNMILLPLCTILILKSSILKGVFAEVVAFSVSLFLELLFSRLLFNFFGVQYIKIVSIPMYRILFSIIIYFVTFILYLLVKKFKVSIPFIEDLDKHTKKLLVLDLLLAFFIIAFQFFMLFYYGDSFSMLANILNIVCIFAYFIISISCFTNIMGLSITTKNLEEEQMSNKTLQLLYDNGRAFRHDFGNILQAIGGYVTTNDMPGLEKYYRQLAADFHYSNNLSNLKPNVINNHAIYNILASKYHKADELGIKIHLDINGDFSNMHMKIYEFSRIIGILLDNALEAASVCEEKVVNVSFTENTERKLQTLYIENTYTNKDVNTDSIFEKGFSTKTGNTGLGLWEVRKLLKRNNNLDLFTNKDDTYFKQELRIFY